MKFRLRLCQLLVGCVLPVVPAAAQLDSAALRAKYGSPLNRETFRMPQGFDLTVDYGGGQQVCRLEVPALMPTDESVQRAGEMKQRMYGFLADLVPAAMRGRELRRFASVMGTISVVAIEYEHATVSEVEHADQPFGNNNTIMVRFQNGDCPR